MSQTDWDALSLQMGGPVRLDVERTPLSGVASEASLVAAVAEQHSSASGEKDEPTPYNIDKYTVWVDLPSHQSFPQVVAAAATEDNENLRQFLRDNVFIVRQDPGQDHWLPEPPTSVQTVFRST